MDKNSLEVFHYLGINASQLTHNVTVTLAVGSRQVLLNLTLRETSSL